MAPVQNKFIFAAVGFIAVATLGEVKSEEIPVELLADIPRTASIAKWDGLYSWVEASRQSVNLSQFDSGQPLPTQIIAPSWAATRSSDPVTNGYGVRGGVGFIIPNGTFSKFNSDLRVQFVTSYVNAATSGSVASDFWISGPISNACECSAISNSITGAMALATYKSWQGELKAATDFSFGRIVVTPAISLFTKDARNYQNAIEGAASSGWTDLGAKIDFDAMIDITKRALVGFRSSVGTAYRSVSFSQGGVADFASFASTANGRPLLASTEVNLIWKPQLGQTVKAYAGVQLDSRVPNAPDPFAIDSGAGGSGSITYQTVQTFYFGGSLKMELGTDPAGRH
jgi:hypothetical protein